MEDRENIINVVIMKRREGKSTLMAEDVIPQALKQGKEVYVFMPKENEKVYGKYYDTEKVYIHITSSLDSVMDVIGNAYNAVIIVEESRVYFKKQLPDYIVTAIINTGQQNVDIHFLCHNYTWTCKDFYRIADTFTIGRCLERPESRRGEFSDDEIAYINTESYKLKPHEHFTLLRG